MAMRNCGAVYDFYVIPMICAKMCWKMPGKTERMDLMDERTIVQKNMAGSLYSGNPGCGFGCRFEKRQIGIKAESETL